MPPTGVDLVTIRAVDPVGPTVYCRHGDGPAKFTSSAGWQTTKRPKRTSMTEFMGPDPYTMIVPVLFGNGYDNSINVDPTIEVLRGIMRNPVGPRNEPAVVSVSGALIPLSWLRWVIDDITLKDEHRRSDGMRYFVAMDITLLQWEPTDLTIATSSKQSVAQKIQSTPAAQSSGTGAGSPNFSTKPVSGWTYTVRSGDTLSAIAATQLGRADRWGEIATLNNIRDPRSVTVGQVLRMPGASAPGSSAANPYPGSATAGGQPGAGIRHF